jgi:hypothetical protein
VDAPAASGATDALGAGGEMDAPGVQAQWTPVQGVEALWERLVRSWARWTRLLRVPGGQWTRLLTGVGRDRQRLLMGWRRTGCAWSSGWRRNGRAPAQEPGAVDALRMELERDGRACSWELRAQCMRQQQTGGHWCARSRGWRRDGRAWGCGNTVCRSTTACTQASGAIQSGYVCRVRLATDV